MMLSLVCFKSHGQPVSGFLRAAIRSVRGFRFDMLFDPLIGCFTRKYKLGVAVTNKCAWELNFAEISSFQFLVYEFKMSLSSF